MWLGIYDATYVRAMHEKFKQPEEEKRKKNHCRRPALPPRTQDGQSAQSQAKRGSSHVRKPAARASRKNWRVLFLANLVASEVERKKKQARSTKNQPMEGQSLPPAGFVTEAKNPGKMCGEGETLTVNALEPSSSGTAAKPTAKSVAHGRGQRERQDQECVNPNHSLAASPWFSIPSPRRFGPARSHFSPQIARQSTVGPATCSSLLEGRIRTLGQVRT